MPRKPLSPKQLAANRANAARSTGPRTPEGKARSAQNARKHGFTASSFTVVRLEDLDEIARLKEDLVTVYQPVNSQELFAIERIAIAQQTLLRTARLESGLLTYCLDEALDRTTGDLFTPMQPALAGDGDIEITRAQNRNLAAATGFHKMAMASNTWSLFLRYQTQAERHYRRAIEDFERLKALRPTLPPETPIEPDSPAQVQENEGPAPPETNPSGAGASAGSGDAIIVRPRRGPGTPGSSSSGDTRLAATAPRRVRLGGGCRTRAVLRPRERGSPRRPPPELRRESGQRAAASVGPLQPGSCAFGRGG